MENLENLQKLNNRISNLENINIESRLHNLEVFQGYCKNTHESHAAKDEIQHITAERHLELINKTISAQEGMASSIKSLSDSLGSISKFIKDNQSVLEMVVSIVTGLRGIKKIILGTAAVVAAMGVILGAMVTIWSIFNAPSLIDALLTLRNLT